MPLKLIFVHPPLTPRYLNDCPNLALPTIAYVVPGPERTCELLATYLLRKLKGELLGKTVLLPATVVYQ
ncbi:hypothetical protein, partial [Exiguobacterium sp. s154]|uniref:hypothetical protein n=1 Tax=Exiguobacterium sp. s154 TaxID=2751277 RepID=UPI002036CB44